MSYEDEKVIVLSLFTTMTIIFITYLLFISFSAFILVSEIYSQSKPEPTVLKVSEHAKQRTVVLEQKIIDIKPVEDTYTKSEEEDIHLLARIINAEAGNQPYKGKLAVGNVVMNRVESNNFPDTIKEVIYQKGQFSPVSNGSINKKPNAESIKAAKEILEGTRLFNKNVVFFYNPKISTSKWIFTRKVVTKIGEHAFAI